jgi:hypothetical protein
MSPFEKPWGSASKVYTTKYDIYKRLVDTDNPHKFARQIDAFHTAVAIGIRLKKTVEPLGSKKSREELVNVYSIDPDGILWAAISALHPDSSGSERYELLMNYADYGIERLDEAFNIYGNLQTSIETILDNN